MSPKVMEFVTKYLAYMLKCGNVIFPQGRGRGYYTPLREPDCVEHFEASDC